MGVGGRGSGTRDVDFRCCFDGIGLRDLDRELHDIVFKLKDVFLDLHDCVLELLDRVLKIQVDVMDRHELVMELRDRVFDVQSRIRADLEIHRKTGSGPPNEPSRLRVFL